VDEEVKDFRPISFGRENNFGQGGSGSSHSCPHWLDRIHGDQANKIRLDGSFLSDATLYIQVVDSRELESVGMSGE
jgi:hypothetical protein